MGVNVCLRGTGAFWDFQGVVTAFDDVESCVEVMFLDSGAEFIGASESVARALDEKHRCFDLRQVCVAEFVWPAGRMKRVAEEDQSGDVTGKRGLRFSLST